MEKKTEIVYEVNKTTYALLAIFLGIFGAHKFYAGKVGMGILYILLAPSGITFLVGFIEGCIALGRTADSNGNIILY